MGSGHAVIMVLLMTMMLMMMVVMMVVMMTMERQMMDRMAILTPMMGHLVCRGRGCETIYILLMLMRQ